MVIKLTLKYGLSRSQTGTVFSFIASKFKGKNNKNFIEADLDLMTHNSQILMDTKVVISLRRLKELVLKTTDPIIMIFASRN